MGAHKMSVRRWRIIGIILCLVGTVILSFNIINMQRYLTSQAKHQGESHLQKVSGDMQRTLDNNKVSLMKLAADTEKRLAAGADDDELTSYLRSQSKIIRDRSEDSLLNAYICAAGWVLISDSPVPEGYDVTSREWYNDAFRSGIGNIHITAPYRDLFTGEMCFTTTLLLSDGKTIVGMDFALDHIQHSMEELSREDGGEPVIITSDGMIVGSPDGNHLGKRLDEAMPEYVRVYKKLVTEKNDSVIIESYMNDEKTTSFCNRSGEWFFIYTIDNKSLYSDADRIVLLNFFPRALMIIAVAAYVVYMKRFMETAKNEKVIYGHHQEDDEKTRQINRDSDEITDITKKSRNRIMVIMTITIAVAMIFSGTVLVNWGGDRIERDVDSYNYQLERWMNTQVQTLNMFVDTISANPSVLDDYEGAVEYLDRIVSNYPEISAAYIARPGNEHEMTMNNGWIPNADYVVSERQWYIDTENSPDGMSVSSPYLDARTGLYCVTFSRTVQDFVTGDRIGIFALDFYIESLTKIMEASYSDDGYAFLVDNSSLIVNHPDSDYQITGDSSTNIMSTEYSALKEDPGLHFIRDYDGGLKVCISRTESVTGFSVIAVKDVISVYGVVTLCGGVFVVLLVVCVILLYKFIFKMIDWQEKTRAALAGEAMRASQADRAKSSFLAQMSHEIRTPINAVLGMSEMILRESGEENILTYASNAYNSCNALLSIINDILDISKIEAGKLEITEAEYDLAALILNCYHMTADRAAKNGLDMRVSCDEKLPARLKGDMFHIRQIIVNLITNAIKYTDEGFVELSFKGFGGSGTLEVSVKDTGIGLKPEDLETLFESFRRFDLQRNRTVEGTGLGLSISKQLAELMGGSISVESVYGKGSVFTVTVPQTVIGSAEIGKLRLDLPAEKIETEAGSRFTAPEARVLVVDDVEMNLFVFKSLLKEHKMQIETALSGKECVELTEKNSYDIIFMDHMMPGMDGMETFALMKSRKLITEDTPVIMLTANAISGEEEKYLAAGFTSYLTKPIRSAKLVRVLLDCLPKEKVIFSDDKPEETKESAKPVGGGDPMLDKDTGLFYNGGSEEIYYTVLKMFYDNGAQKSEDIRRLAAEENWKDYITEVHALKSTSLAIGSAKLSEAAKELELAGKNGSYDVIRDKNEPLLELYAKVLELCRELIETMGGPAESVTEDDEPKQEISEEQLREYIKKIEWACGNFDIDEIIKLCGEASAYAFKGRSLATNFKAVSQCAEVFEYDDALDSLREVKKMLAS